MPSTNGRSETIQEYILRWSDEDMVAYSRDEDFLFQMDEDDLRAMVKDLADRLDGYMNAMDEGEPLLGELPFHNEDDQEL